MDDNNTNVDKDDLFINNLSSTLSVKRDYELKEYHFEWLDIIEETLPYIDNIIRNPKRFIINEEEVVKVEQSKKITVESVIHLTQHTALIQKYDPKKGDVRPSKVLNINKEESLDTYENRFVYTLINNLSMFFDERVKATGDNSFIDKKDLVYEGKTKVGKEDVSISVQINSYNKDIKEKASSGGLTYDERVAKVRKQVEGFKGSELYQTLYHMHTPPVRSPIRKTNVILKNPNFQKAEELWNYIQSYISKDRREKEKLNYYDKGSLKGNYDQVFLMNYLANKVIGDQDNNDQTQSEKKLVIDMLDKLIENIMDTEIDMSEDKLKEIFNKEIETIKKKNQEKANNIIKVFNDRFEKEEQNMDDIFELLEYGD